MLVLPLIELRRQYPEACLTTDLLIIHESLFVVKAYITVGERVLATGMAAAPLLEQAEDHACLRATQRLGLSSSLPESSVEDSTPVFANPAKADSAPLEVSRLTSEIPQRASEVPQRISTAPEPIFPNQTAEPQPLVEPHPPGGFPDESADRQEEGRKSPPAEQTSENFSVPTSPTGLLISAIDTAQPVDFSDIIAQTDMELRRLGWSVVQGREFLEHTYGKRSRHDLTDEELLQFLLFLETQPSPVSGGNS